MGPGDINSAAVAASNTIRTAVGMAAVLPDGDWEAFLLLYERRAGKQRSRDREGAGTVLLPHSRRLRLRLGTEPVHFLANSV